MPVPKTSIQSSVISTLSIVASIILGTFYFENKVKEIFAEALKPFDTRITALENDSRDFESAIEFLKPTVKLNEYKISQLQEFILPERPRIKGEYE